MTTATEIKDNLPRTQHSQLVLMNECGKAIYTISYLADYHGRPAYTLTHLTSETNREDCMICYFNGIDDKFNKERYLYLTFEDYCTVTIVGIDTMTMKMIE